MPYRISERMLRSHWAVAAAGSLLFAVWYAFHQMTAVSPTFRANVPIKEYLPTISTTFLVMLCIYGSALMTIPRAINPRANLWPAAARSFTFVGSILIAILLAPLAGAVTFTLFVLVFWGREFWSTASPVSRKWSIKEYLVPLAIIAVAYCFLIQSVSPFYLFHAATRAAETYLSASTLAMRNYMAAYSYSFSPFTHTFWGAVQDVPTGLTSLPLSIFSFLNIFSVWEASSFFKLLVLIHFCGYVLLAYFLYLFLRRSRITRVMAIGVALLYFVGNQFYLVMLTEDTGWVLASYLTLSIALWLLSVALQKDSLLTGAWAGLVLGSQSYILAPHPEVLIYSVGIYALVAFAYIAIGDRVGCSRVRAILINVAAGAAFLAVSLAYIIPVIAQVRAGNLDVFGEITTIDKTYSLYNERFGFYVIALALGALLELCREMKFRRTRYALFGFLAVGVVILPLSFPGVPTHVRAAMHMIGWTVHLLPPDRILAILGLATLVVVAIGIDAGIKLIRTSPVWIRIWTLFASNGGRGYAAFANGILSAVGFAALVFVMISGIGSEPRIDVLDPSTRPVYETLQAVLANSLTPVDQQASLNYVRDRLLSFQGDVTASPTPAMTAARTEFAAALKSEGAVTVSELPNARVRPFADQVAPSIDRAYFATGVVDDIPENVDAYLAKLDDPYLRVMAIVGAKFQTSFLSAARNVTDAHNNTMMYDTRVYAGFPMIQALYMYPVSTLPDFRYVLSLTANYTIINARYPWLYETSDILGNEDFRTLLGIAGVGAYLMLPEKAVLDAVADPTTELTQVSGGQIGWNNFVLVRDKRAYDTAYLAREVAEVEPSVVEAAVAGTHAFYRQQIDMESYRKIIDPMIQNLIHFPHRHDAIIVRPSGAPHSDAQAPAEGPSSRGGTAKIDGVIGPRVGVAIHCPDPQCTLVYNLAALPGWKAYVDGKSTTISLANYAFLAVDVPKGDHYVGFFYQTAGQTFADIATLLVLLGLLLLSWRERLLGNNGRAMLPA